jgi:hypothetical protein
MSVASCRFCGATDPLRKPGGILGEPAGPCRKCGHLMFWEAQHETPLASEKRFANELRERADRARGAYRALNTGVRSH